MTVVDPEVLAPLAALDRARGTVAEYYVPLLEDADEVVRVAAWLTLLSSNELPEARFGEAVSHARYGAIKRLAFDFFESNFEHERAAAVAAVNIEAGDTVDGESMHAELAGDLAAASEAQCRLYLATGRIDALFGQMEFAYRAKGTDAAIPLAVRNAIINPHEPMGVIRLLQFCAETGEANLVDAVTSRLNANALHPYTSAVYAAAAAALRGRPQAALDLLGQLPAASAPPAVITKLRAKLLQLRAQSLEALGDFRAALDSYLEMKRPPTGGSVLDPQVFRGTVIAAARLAVPNLADDGRSAWFAITGFPRSGTTLLENILDAHPQIETFEEPPTRPAVRVYLDRALPTTRNETERVAVFAEARRRYYAEMERRPRKPGAHVHIEKQPMASADAGFLARLFPQRRYLFSIRHPHDVVISCLKQDFARDIAMDNFQTFETAVALYDFTMQEWFAAFSLDDPRIHYMRYEGLVGDFEPTVRRMMSFLSLDWDPAVYDFAAGAGKRAAKTPSYQKVRQGLSIGVQSSWRNYGFLFQSEAARPLRKWVEHFGYDAT